jgi:predicted transcriptional regulator
MKTITVRVDDRLDSMLASLAKTLKTTNSEVVRKAVLNYEKNVSRENLRQQIRSASLKP